VYLGFVIINIELLEIIIDGLFGTHRVCVLGSLYDVLIAPSKYWRYWFCSGDNFLAKKKCYKIENASMGDLKGFLRMMPIHILYFEVVLMTLFLLMNASDCICRMLYQEVFSFYSSRFFSNKSIY
jgi:hypothetical protein